MKVMNLVGPEILEHVSGKCISLTFIPLALVVLGCFHWKIIFDSRQQISGSLRSQIMPHRHTPVSNFPLVGSVIHEDELHYLCWKQKQYCLLKHHLDRL